MNILRKICDDENIHCRHIPDDAKALKSLSGIALKFPNGEKNILLNEDITAGKWENWLIIAHELGHLLFGHLEQTCTLTNEMKEDEARTFSCVFIALMLYDKYRSDDVQKE